MFLPDVNYFFNPPAEERRSCARISHAGGWVSGTWGEQNAEAGTSAALAASSNLAEFYRGTSTGWGTLELTLDVPGECDHLVLAEHNLGSTGANVAA